MATSGDIAEAQRLYMEAFLQALSTKDAEAIINRSRNSSRAKTRVWYHGLRQQNLLELSSIPPRKTQDGQERAIVMVENIDLNWIAALGVAWDVEPAFFAGHAFNPPGLTPWQAVFGPTPSEQRKPAQNRHNASASLQSASSPYTEKYWHVDGILEYKGSNSKSNRPGSLADLNVLQRRLQYDPAYGWHASTRVSYCLVDPSLYLILIDSTMTLDTAVRRNNPYAKTELHLPLSENRGGLVLPQLFDCRTFSLFECLQRFLSHRWHVNVLFALPGSGSPLTPETLFYLMVTSTWATNLRYLNSKIESIAFEDIRRPNVAINDELHDCRQGMANLRSEVSKAKKWMPQSVHAELDAVSQKLGSREYVGFPDAFLDEILDNAETTDKVLMDTFQLLMSSISVLQASRAQKLTQLAFIYVPLSFVTGVFGMNVKEVNGSPLSVWVVVVTLAVTALCTVAGFELYNLWDQRTIKRDRKSATA